MKLLWFRNGIIANEVSEISFCEAEKIITCLSSIGR